MMDLSDISTDELSDFRVEFFDTDRAGSPLPPFFKRAYCLGRYRGQLLYTEMVVTQDLIEDSPLSLDKILKVSTLNVARWLFENQQRTPPGA